MTHVGNDVNNLIQETRDYVSDALTQIDSAHDKIAFLDWVNRADEMSALSQEVGSILKSLKSVKNKVDRLIATVRP